MLSSRLTQHIRGAHILRPWKVVKIILSRVQSLSLELEVAASQVKGTKGTAFTGSGNSEQCSGAGERGSVKG